MRQHEKKQVRMSSVKIRIHKRQELFRVAGLPETLLVRDQRISQGVFSIRITCFCIFDACCKLVCLKLKFSSKIQTFVSNIRVLETASQSN